MKVIKMVAFGLTVLLVASVAYAGGINPKKFPNHQYQLSPLKTCTASGTPNYELPKALNPVGHGYSSAGAILCNDASGTPYSASAWPYQNGLYFCFDASKAPYYSCSNDNG